MVILKFMLISILKKVGYFDFSKYLCYAGFSVIAIDFCFYLISLFSYTIVFQNFFNLIFLVVPVNEVPEMEHSFKKTEHRYVTEIRKNPKIQKAKNDIFVFSHFSSSFVGARLA